MNCKTSKTILLTHYNPSHLDWAPRKGCSFFTVVWCQCADKLTRERTLSCVSFMIADHNLPALLHQNASQIKEKNDLPFREALKIDPCQSSNITGCFQTFYDFSKNLGSSALWRHLRRGQNWIGMPANAFRLWKNVSVILKRTKI